MIDYGRNEIDCNGPRYDVILGTAGDRPLSLLRRALTPRGRLLPVGGGYDQGPLLGGFDRQLRAPLLSPWVGQRLRSLTAKEGAESLEELTRLIDSGAVRPVVARSYLLAEAPEAIRQLTATHAAGKTVITV